MKLHSIVPLTRANGPGRRTAFWVQGCTLACPGCINPATHPDKARRVLTVAAMLDTIHPDAEGVTLTGGEPLQQREESFAFLAAAKASGRNTVLFTGYSQEEILAMPSGANILLACDAIIAGRYRQDLRRERRPLLASDNQRLLIPPGSAWEKNHAEVFWRLPFLEFTFNLDALPVITGVP